jgi:hypothetical protein
MIHKGKYEYAKVGKKSLVMNMKRGIPKKRDRRKNRLYRRDGKNTDGWTKNGKEYKKKGE